MKYSSNMQNIAIIVKDNNNKWLVTIGKHMRCV